MAREDKDKPITLEWLLGKTIIIGGLNTSKRKRLIKEQWSNSEGLKTLFLKRSFSRRDSSGRFFPNSWGNFSGP